MRKIQLSDHFTKSTILLFALPSIGMQLVDNTYAIADGYFISNYIGENAFAAENLIYPPIQIIMAAGLMFGTGASALIAKELGEGNREKANRLLSLIVLAIAVLDVVLSAVLFVTIPSISRLVGTPEDMIPGCVDYGRMLAVFMPVQMLSSAFHSLLITAERPGLGLVTTVANALRIISFSFLLFGVTTFSSSYFTGLNQGTASLLIALMKGFVGPLLMVWLLPLIMGGDGIWLSPTAAEVLALLTALGCFIWWNRTEEKHINGALPEE